MLHYLTIVIFDDMGICFRSEARNYSAIVSGLCRARLQIRNSNEAPYVLVRWRKFRRINSRRGNWCASRPFGQYSDEISLGRLLLSLWPLLASCLSRSIGLFRYTNTARIVATSTIAIGFQALRVWALLCIFQQCNGVSSGKFRFLFWMCFIATCFPTAKPKWRPSWGSSLDRPLGSRAEIHCIRWGVIINLSPGKVKTNLLGRENSNCTGKLN